MASTYSTRLRLELITNGEQSATWGTTTNTNLGTLLEEAIAGVAAVVMTDANYTLTANNGATDEARRAVLQVTGTLTANRNVTVPTQTKIYSVFNNTTGGFSIVVKTAAGSGITVANGKKRLVYCDGTNVVDLFSDLPSGATLNNAALYSVGGTDVALADGGTGASLTDPNADRILFWDDSAGAVTWLTPGTGLTITTTTIDSNYNAASVTITGGTIAGITSLGATGGTITGLTSLGYSSTTTAGFRMQANGASFYFPFAFENNSITSAGQGFAVYYRLGTGGSPADAAYNYVISTDTWAASGNRSCDLVWFVSQAGSVSERLRLSGGTGGNIVTGNLTVASGTLQAMTRGLTTTSGTLVAADADCVGTCTGNITLPNSIFAAKNTQLFDAGASARTFTRGSGIAMYVNGSNAATATLAADSLGTVFWRDASTAILGGAFT